MIKKILAGIISVLLVFILQSSVFSALNIGGIVPNLLIILTASWGFMEGERTGLIVGFACGLLMDIFSGPFIGLYAMIFMYIGYANGKLCNLFYPDDIKLPLVLITTSDLAYGISCYIFLYLLRGRLEFGYYLVHIIFPEVIATLLLTFVQYPLTLTVHKKLLKKSSRTK